MPAKVKNDIYINMASGKFTALMLVNLSAAFHTIHHNPTRVNSYFCIEGSLELGPVPLTE